MTIPADWMAAVGTVGAFGVSLFLLGRDQVARSRDRHERLADQARRISVWVEDRGGRGSPRGWIQSVEVFMRNGSEELVRGVAVDVGLYYSIQNEKPVSTAFTAVDFLPPGDTICRTLEFKGTRSEERPLWEVETTFVDASGKVWARDRFGRLVFDEDLDDPEPLRPSTKWKRPYRTPIDADDP